jgi:hypothetical protein
MVYGFTDKEWGNLWAGLDHWKYDLENLIARDERKGTVGRITRDCKVWVNRLQRLQNKMNRMKKAEKIVDKAPVKV